MAFKMSFSDRQSRQKDRTPACIFQRDLYRTKVPLRPRKEFNFDFGEFPLFDAIILFSTLKMFPKRPLVIFWNQ